MKFTLYILSTILYSFYFFLIYVFMVAFGPLSFNNYIIYVLTLFSVFWPFGRVYQTFDKFKKDPKKFSNRYFKHLPIKMVIYISAFVLSNFF